MGRNESEHVRQLMSAEILSTHSCSAALPCTGWRDGHKDRRRTGRFAQICRQAVFGGHVRVNRNSKSARSRLLSITKLLSIV